MNEIQDLRSLLQAEFSGTAAMPGDAAYEACVAIWAKPGSRPKAALVCHSAIDVQSAVRLAAKAGLPLSVRAGGHDWAGRALCDGLVIDLTAMRAAQIAPDRSWVRIGGGMRGRDLFAHTDPIGRAPVTGSMGAVGLAGLTLGGGYGSLAGRYGLASDNLVGAEVVLADGQIVRAEAGDAELLWALRGGGGNFGLVTAMRVQLHRTPTLLSGQILFPWAQASAVLARLAEFVPEGPDELTVQCGVLAGPDGAPAVFVMPTWSGDDARAGEETLARLTALGEPLVAQLGPTTGHDMLASTDAMFPYGKHVEIRTRTVPALTSAVRAALLDAGDTLTSPLSAVSLHSLHGIASRIPATDTAFGNRTAHLMVEAIARWEPGDPREPEHRAWARDVSAVLESEAMPGGYPNLLGPDETKQIAHAYGPNTERLLAAKHRFDPDGVFRAIPLPVPSV